MRFHEEARAFKVTSPMPRRQRILHRYLLNVAQLLVFVHQAFSFVL